MSFTSSATVPRGTTPINNSTITSSSLPAISGVAADSGSGVAKVVLYIYRRMSTSGVYQYWNGSSWVVPSGAAPKLVSTLIPAGGGSSVSWSYNSAALSGSLFGNNTYTLFARAYDRANNTASATSRFTKATGGTSGATLTSAHASASTSSITLQLSGALPPEDFEVTVNGQEVEVRGVQRDGSTVTLLLADGALQAGDKVVISWQGGKVQLSAE